MEALTHPRPNPRRQHPKSSPTGQTQTKELRTFFWLGFSQTRRPRHTRARGISTKHRSPNHTTFYDASTSNPPMGKGKKVKPKPPRRLKAATARQRTTSARTVTRMVPRTTPPFNSARLDHARSLFDLRLRFHKDKDGRHVTHSLHHHHHQHPPTKTPRSSPLSTSILTPPHTHRAWRCWFGLNFYSTCLTQSEFGFLWRTW